MPKFSPVTCTQTHTHTHTHTHTACCNLLLSLPFHPVRHPPFSLPHSLARARSCALSFTFCFQSGGWVNASNHALTLVAIDIRILVAYVVLALCYGKFSAVCRANYAPVWRHRLIWPEESRLCLLFLGDMVASHWFYSHRMLFSTGDSRHNSILPGQATKLIQQVLCRATLCSSSVSLTWWLVL